MERYFIFDEFNTYADWGLILTSKDVTPPEPKTNYIDLDGMSGSLDLSEALTGEITYQDRTVTATFWTDTGYRKDRERLLQTIRTALHGKKVKIIEPDDPEHYFYGRVKVKGYVNHLAYAELEIEAVCEPWRYTLTDIERRVELIDTPISIVINNNGVKTLSPTITVDGLLNLIRDGGTTVLTTGSYKVSDLKLYQGANVINVYGSGSVTFTYKEADL